MAHQRPEEPLLERQDDEHNELNNPDFENESQEGNREERESGEDYGRRRPPVILFQLPLGGLGREDRGFDALTNLMLASMGAAFYTAAMPTNGGPARFIAYILPLGFRRPAPRLSRTYLNGLPETPLTEAQHHECADCSICLETWESGSHVITLPCNHFFHPPCVRTWLESRHTCPVCRYEMQTDDADFERGRVQRMEQRANEQREARERLRKSIEEKEQKVNNEQETASVFGSESVKKDDGEGLQLRTRKRKTRDAGEELEKNEMRFKRARTDAHDGEGQGDGEAREEVVVARRSRRVARLGQQGLR